MIKSGEIDDFINSLQNQKNKELIRELLRGNENWINSDPKVKGQRRKELEHSQDPKIVMLTCADSRVSPEYIFDVEIGEIFVIKVAGNVINPEILASIEFSFTELDSTLLCILGHENCGAIQAKLNDPDHENIKSENLDSLLNRIDVDTDKSIKDNVIYNIKYQVKKIRDNSNLTWSLFDDNDIDIVGMYYELNSGKVNLLHPLE